MALTASLTRIVAFLDPKEPELDQAFESLPGGPAAPSPDGDTWQYLGTAITANETLVHTFRHRCHPYTGRYMYKTVPASENFQPQQVTL